MSIIEWQNDLPRRFLYSAGFNFLRSGLNFATGMLIARWLGPEEMGRIAFLLGSFLAFRQLIDMSSTSAFFTFVSKQPRSKSFVNYFWIWTAIQLIFSLAIVLLILPASLVEAIWLGEARSLVALGLIATFFQHQVWLTASQLAEAQRETKRVQFLGALVSLCHLIVMSSLWLVGNLVIPLIFLAIAIEWMCASLLAAGMYKHGNARPGGGSDTPRTMISEFMVYCLPLIPYAWLSFVYELADRWMLQKWAGSKEQAYFAVAAQISSVVILAVSSILKIFWKEIAETWHSGDRQKVAEIFNRVFDYALLFCSLVAGALVPTSDFVIKILLGNQYLSGATTLAIMFCYPIHQAVGQLIGALFMATGNVKPHVVGGMIFMIASIVGTYFVLAPSEMPGFTLSLLSSGLAAKMLLIQFIHVSVMAWLCSRIFGTNFKIISQTMAVSWFIFLGFLSHGIVQRFMGDSLLSLSFGFFAYFALVGISLFLFGNVFSLSRRQTMSFLGKVFSN